MLATVQHYYGFIAILQTSHLHLKIYEIDHLQTLDKSICPRFAINIVVAMETVI